MKPSSNIPEDPRSEALAIVPAEERENLGEIWDLTQNSVDIPDFSAADIAHTWAQIAAQTQPPQGARDIPGMRLVSRRWLAIAATLLIGAVGLGWLFTPVKQTAPAGAPLAVVLQDGSRVLLNSGSSISYNRRFTAKRQLTLDGEAFFDVAHSEVPFELETFNARIEVLGTTFNVKSWQESVAPATVVSLVEGSVRLSPGNTDTHDTDRNGVVLVPGQTRSVAASNMRVSQADTEALATALAWQSGDLVYRDTWLGVILEDIERKFGIDINLQSPQLLDKEFTFVYRQPNEATAVIESLCEGLGLRYSQTARGVVIYPPDTQ